MVHTYVAYKGYYPRIPLEFSDPQNRENVRPHSGNSIGKLQPHFSQPSRENVTQSSSTSPLAYYKEVLAWMGLYLGGRGWGGLLSSSLCCDLFVEKWAKGSVRLLRPFLFPWFYPEN